MSLNSVYWYWANCSQVRPISLDLDGFFPCTEGCPGMSLWNLSQKSLKIVLTIFYRREWVYVPYSCFLRGLYRIDGTVIIALIMHSSLSCNDDCPYGRNRTLIGQSMLSLLHGLDNHIKKGLLTCVIYWLSCQNLRLCNWLSI